jgi:Tol biopolymer transport system component
MGEVYKARDVRLERFVAIKVLPAEFASDPERLRRFGQEARAASALNHPNILTILDVGTEDSVSYIAMELVDGKTLRDLLAAGPLATKRLLDISVQIAEGLASAHEAGIVHRDLKPANVMVTRGEFVKILDFGLAKSAPVQPEADGVDTTALTESVSETEPGQLVGTVSYMSPEQAAGKRVDFRSDQFSFGAILYEMATGRRAFRRGSTIDTLSAILHENPEPIGSQGARVPPPLRWILERCLAKEPESRFASTRDLARDLSSLRDHIDEMSDSASGGWASAPELRPLRSPFVRIAGAAALALLLAGAAFLVLKARGGGEPITLSLEPPPDAAFNFNTSAPAPAAFSPDGRRIVFGARDTSGNSLLWIRALDESRSRPLAGTEGAIYPFWSPDSRFIAFFAGGKLRRLDPSGGVAETLADAHDGRGGSWSRRGTILIAPDSTGPIVEVPAGGGAPRSVTNEDTPAGDYSHRWPFFLPDGRHFLYLRRNPVRHEEGVYVASVEGGTPKRLLPDSSNAMYSEPGYLVFTRSGSLVAAAFDAAALALRGEPLVLGESVNYHSYRWNGAFTVSENGRLAYEPGPPSRAALLTWFDRSGRELGSVGPPGDYGGIRLSPDGDHCAVEIRDPVTGMMGVWVMELTRGVATRLSSAGSMNVSPTWSPDGGRIVWTSSRAGHWNLVQRDSTAAGPEEQLTQSRTNQSPTDWSPDGTRIAFNNSGPDPGEKYQVWMFSVHEKQPAAHLRSAFNERDAAFSPDGELLAYVSDESGRQEVFVRPVRSDSRKWQISRDGGNQPAWRRDGREIWYLGPNNGLYAVSVEPGAEPHFGVPSPLFEAPLRASPSDISLFAGARDGQRFLIVTAARNAAPPLNVVLNWTKRLRR